MGIKASAQSGADLTHSPWEYSIINENKVKDQYGMPFGIFLDYHGGEGWELTAITGPKWIFKRKKHRPRGRKKAE